MGRDLLHTHFGVDAEGERRPRSEWALVITSEAVTQALLVEIASFARQAADQCSALALPQSADVVGNAPARRRLNAACQWLWALDISARTAPQPARSARAATAHRPPTARAAPGSARSSHLSLVSPYLPGVTPLKWLCRIFGGGWMC
jgi:hypothetical protein